MQVLSLPEVLPVLWQGSQTPNSFSGFHCRPVSVVIQLSPRPGKLQGTGAVQTPLLWLLQFTRGRPRGRTVSHRMSWSHNLFNDSGSGRRSVSPHHHLYKDAHHVTYFWESHSRSILKKSVPTYHTLSYRLRYFQRRPLQCCAWIQVRSQ